MCSSGSLAVLGLEGIGKDTEPRDVWSELTGDDMQDLFITTASCTVTKPELQPDFPQSGDLFKVRIEGIKGVERHRWHS